MLIKNNIEDETDFFPSSPKVVPFLTESDTKAIISRTSLL